MNDPINIEDWFDPTNSDHIQAFIFLNENGSWPENFIPPHVKFNQHWLEGIYRKLANEWVDRFFNIRC